MPVLENDRIVKNTEEIEVSEFLLSNSPQAIADWFIADFSNLTAGQQNKLKKLVMAVVIISKRILKELI